MSVGVLFGVEGKQLHSVLSDYFSLTNVHNKAHLYQHITGPKEMRKAVWSYTYIDFTAINILKTLRFIVVWRKRSKKNYSFGWYFARKLNFVQILIRNLFVPQQAKVRQCGTAARA